MGNVEDDRLFDEAVGHVVRLQGDPQNAVARETLRLWCARSPRHGRIWAEVAEIHGLTGQVFAPPARQTITRRRAILAGIGGAAAIGAGFAVLPGTLLAARADHMTEVAEIDRIVLPDSSRITLGPKSAFTLEFVEGARGLRLLSGMVHCELVSNPARPFRLRVRDVEITTAGGALNLSLDAGIVALALEHGTAAIGGLHMGEGTRIDLSPDAQVLGPPRPAAAQGASWRDGLIVADAEPVAVLIAQIARWMPGQVVIAGGGLADQRVSGVFDLSDPAAALAAVVHPHGGRVRQITPFMTVVSSL